jgi:hypothetical protein
MRLALALLTFAVSCSDGKESSGPQRKIRREVPSKNDLGQKETTPSPTTPPAPGTPDTVDAAREGLNIKRVDQLFLSYGLGIREVGENGSHAGVLLLLKPASAGNGSSLVVTDIDAPVFLGNAAVDVLTTETVRNIFNGEPHTLANSAREELLKDYTGAALVYFGGYGGGLCSGNEFSFTVDALLNGNPVRSEIRFVGTQTGKGCVISDIGIKTTF